MPNYDAQRFNPPAPVALVTLRNPETGIELHGVPMLIDTGADVTLLPAKSVAILGINTDANQQYELIGFDQSTSKADMAVLALAFQGRTFRGQFLLIEQEWGIIGRNLLNAIPLLLDGPHLIWDVRR
jgi:predicted aspartyl protease